MSDTSVRQFDHFDPSCSRHPRLPSFLIFDENGRSLYPIGRSITNDAQFYEWSADNLKEVENGILVQENSIEALAIRLGLDRESLAASVGRWNANAAGVDRDFGRPPETMLPISTPPYYAARLWPMIINTQGGPVHDSGQRILDPFGEPIPRLFAAGEMGSVFGHVYMSGGNLTECFIGGRIAGENAMALGAI
jgi:succinate dehydrogenase/fumarate reductase flavoprotein subunit